MKAFQHSIKIKATPKHIWEKLIDVERWNELFFFGGARE